MKISIIIPAYNEEKGLPRVIEEYFGKGDEIIVVDDGSIDRTYEIAKTYDVKLYHHEKNLGKVAAISTGIKNAIGDIIVLTDADYTYPAKYIPNFVEEIEKGADLVLGSRFIGKQPNMPFLNILGNKIFSFLTTYISCINITDGQTGYRAFKRELFGDLNVEAKGLEFETKMTVRAAKLGYKIVEIPIEYRTRIGESKLRPIKDGYKMFMSLISIAINESSIIVRTIIFLSIFLIISGLYFGSLSIFQKFKYGVISHDYYPLLTVFLIFISIQLISMGLLIDHLTKKLDRIDEKIRKS